jgi:hypothetical protein
MRFLERGGRALASAARRLLTELRDRRFELILGLFLQAAMRFLERGGRALADETWRLLAALRDRRLALILGLFLALLLLAAQAPLRYAIQVGQEDGPGSDLPLLDGFYGGEEDLRGDFRWTSARSTIQLPGLGQRPLQLTLRVFPIGPEVAERGAREIEVWDGGREIVRLPVRPGGATYLLMLPPPADGSGDHIVELHSATFVPSGDERALGVPLDALYAAVAGWPALPAWRGTLGWLGVATLAWLALRRAGFGPRSAAALLLPGIALAGVAALLDPPRFALGAVPALISLALGFLLVLLLEANTQALLLAGAAVAVAAGAAWAVGKMVGGPSGGQAGIALHQVLAGVAAALLLAGWLRPPAVAFYRRLGPPIVPEARRWLILFALLVLALRYGGKLYPDAMPGDIGFHSNRYDLLVSGLVLQPSIHRGVSFPYPPAFYLLLAPFSLLGLTQRVLLRLGGALLDALSPFLIYMIAASVRGDAKGCNSTRTGHQIPLVAAAIYAFSPAGFMATWWNFSTHIFAQFAHVLLMTAVVLIWRPLFEERGTRNEERGTSILIPRSSLLSVLVVLQSLVYLGHFGFWMNVTLLGGIVLALLLWAALRGRVPWPAFRTALFCFVGAELLGALLFYSGYTGQFVDQLRVAATGGLTGLAGRASVDRDVLWRTLWDAGVNAHLGFLPLPLALCGMLLLRRPTTNDQRPTTNDEHHSSLVTRHSSLVTRHTAFVLMVGTFAIGALFAALPFLSGSTLATRWLMFSLWAVAVGAALSLDLLWRRGRAGQALALAVGGYVVWLTASMWLMALAWRVRPPEPF